MTMARKTVCGWVFRIEIVSDKTPWTKDIQAKLQELFRSQDLFGNWKVTELFEDVSILEGEKKKDLQKHER